MNVTHVTHKLKSLRTKVSTTSVTHVTLVMRNYLFRLMRVRDEQNTHFGVIRVTRVTSILSHLRIPFDRIRGATPGFTSTSSFDPKKGMPHEC